MKIFSLFVVLFSVSAFATDLCPEWKGHHVLEHTLVIQDIEGVAACIHLGVPFMNQKEGVKPSEYTVQGKVTVMSGDLECSFAGFLPYLGNSVHGQINQTCGNYILRFNTKAKINSDQRMLQVGLTTGIDYRGDYKLTTLLKNRFDLLREEKIDSNSPETPTYFDDSDRR